MDERENDEKNVMGCRGEHRMRGGSCSALASHYCLSPGKPCDPQGGGRSWLPFGKGMSLLSQLREIKKTKNKNQKNPQKNPNSGTPNQRSGAPWERYYNKASNIMALE